MTNYGEGGDKQVIGSNDFGGSIWVMVLLVVVVLWTLFKDGHNAHGDYGHAYNMPYPGYNYGGNCAPCVQPTFKDESNWEQEYHLCKELGCVDKDVLEQGCKTREVEHCEAEKTRDLIRSESEKEWMYRLNKANTKIAMLESNAVNEKRFDQLERMNERRFDQLAGGIGKIDCELPKRPPVFAECVTPNTHDIDCSDRFPRRGRCHDNFGFEGCCA